MAMESNDALAAAKMAVERADQEREKANRRVEELMRELEQARTVSQVAEDIYQEELDEYRKLGGSEDEELTSSMRRSRLSKKVPSAARRISKCNTFAADRIEALLQLGDFATDSDDESITMADNKPNKIQDITIAEDQSWRSEGNGITIAEDQSWRSSGNGSRRLSMATEKVLKYNKAFATRSVQMSLSNMDLTRPQRWLSSFRRLDPRYQILSFFNDVAQEGAANIEEKGINPESQPALLRFLNKANVFTVWRPTSQDAIRKMMTGEATGKGLEIKGKSAKRGLLSSLVPFVQIYEEAHKERIRECVKDGTMRVFFSSEKARDDAAELLNDVVEMMMFFVQDAMQILSNPDTTPEEEKLVLKHLQWDGVDLGVISIDTYAPKSYGVEITERLFWEAFVMMQDCSRPPGSQHDTGRPSEPAFQDMNFKAIRHIPTDPKEPVPVVWQTDPEYPMSPRTLVMAYEENGRVLPVVSDFDCFLTGTRGVQFDSPLPPDQIDLVNWTVSKIESLLESPASDDTWTKRWLGILKQEAVKGFYPKMPRFGFGDPKSYSLMQCAVDRLKDSGSVRHGAECFNYYFPQDLDDEFLVISDTLPGGKSWKYVGAEELQEILLEKIDRGFTFPLNPKWVLCDPGWKRVYDKLLASQARNVQQSLEIWFPPASGIRERIERVYQRHPRGFFRHRRGDSSVPDGREQMEVAELELEHFIIFEKAKRKIRAALLCICLANSLPSARAQRNEWESSFYQPSPRRASRALYNPPPAPAPEQNVHFSAPNRRDDFGRESTRTYVSAPPRSTGRSRRRLQGEY